MHRMLRLSVALATLAALSTAGSRPASAGTITSVSAGPGLSGGGSTGDVTLSALFAGSGTATTVCRSDHQHVGESWVSATAPGAAGLRIIVSATADAAAVYGVTAKATCSQLGGACYGFGLDGQNETNQGAGVRGFDSSPTGSTSGVLGVSSSTSGTGVSGISNPASGTTFGVYGGDKSTAGYGVFGENTAVSGSTYGVFGQVSSAAGSAGYFLNKAGGPALRVRVTASGAKTKWIVATNGAYLSAGGAWTNASDVRLKQGFAAIDGEALLTRLGGLPISQWSYKSEGTSIRHIGPTAQDFHSAFQLGTDDTSITTVDESGVALAAIQALERRTRELAAMANEVAALKEQLANLQAAVGALTRSGVPR